MNLNAMEGLAEPQAGCPVLSRNAGVYGRLGRYALPVNPFDVDEMAEALEQAISMPVDERTAARADCPACAGEPSGTVGPGSARGPRSAKRRRR
jgi:trehalose-6-phosphate synthase